MIKTQLERMLAGKLYDPSDAELAELRLKAHKLSRRYNNTDEDETELRGEILAELTPNAQSGCFCRVLCILTTAYSPASAKTAMRILTSQCSTAAL